MAYANRHQKGIDLLISDIIMYGLRGDTRI